MKPLLASLALLFSPAAVACEPVELGVEYTGGYLGWNGIMLGMTVDQVKERVGFAVEARPPRRPGNCGRVVANLEHRETSLGLCFRGKSSNERLASIFVRRPSPCPLRDIVEQLKTLVPSLKYQPNFKAPNVSESESEKPIYVLAQDPDQGVLVGPTEGIWVTYVNLID